MTFIGKKLNSNSILYSETNLTVILSFVTFMKQSKDAILTLIFAVGGAWCVLEGSEVSCTKRERRKINVFTMCKKISLI